MRINIYQGYVYEGHLVNDEASNARTAAALFLGIWDILFQSST